MKKTGLFFGTFNPIHIGHLALANFMTEYYSLDSCWFVITPQNPFKQKQSLLPEYHRYRMVMEAIEEYPRFRASDVEFHLSRPSYTINTLAHLKEKYPENEFLLIMGSDNLHTLEKWKNFEVIINNYSLLIYPRPGYEKNPFPEKKNIIFTDAPLMNISSSFIRKGIKEGKNLCYFVHPAVWKYIEEMRFYK
jgi:nicotinate-nucleotide adenylyltransferase